MGYVTENLLTGEKVVYQTRLHWIIFVWPALLVLFGFLFPGGRDTGEVRGWLVVLGIAAGLFQAAHYKTAEFGVTDRRVLMKTGVLRRRSLEINLAKIESVAVDQGILGRILGYG